MEGLSMSILSMGRGAASKGNRRPSLPAPAHPDQEPPRPRRNAQGDQHTLGNVTLQAVDQLAGMTADEIERTADRLVEAAREVAQTLRECASRIRVNGTIANDRLANFVEVASTCADAARVMQTKIETRDEDPPSPPPPPVAKELEPERTEPHQPDMKALAAEIGVKDG